MTWSQTGQVDMRKSGMIETSVRGTEIASSMFFVFRHLLPFPDARLIVLDDIQYVELDVSFSTQPCTSLKAMSDNTGIEDSLAVSG